MNTSLWFEQATSPVRVFDGPLDTDLDVDLAIIGVESSRDEVIESLLVLVLELLGEIPAARGVRAARTQKKGTCGDGRYNGYFFLFMARIVSENSGEQYRENTVVSDVAPLHSDQVTGRIRTCDENHCEASANRGQVKPPRVACWL